MRLVSVWMSTGFGGDQGGEDYSRRIRMGKESPRKVNESPKGKKKIYSKEEEESPVDVENLW